MANSIIGHRGQSLYDIAVQHCGGADYAADIAVANGLALDAVLEGDVVLVVPDGAPSRRLPGMRVSVEPATGVAAMRDGIGSARVGELTVD